MRVPSPRLFAAALATVEEHLSRTLPTQRVSHWVAYNKPAELESLLLYTAPISGYRGRHLASHLELRLPGGYGLDASRGADASQGKSSLEALIQLRYPLSSSKGNSLAHLYTLEGQDRGWRPGQGSQHTVWWWRAYNKHLLLEDFDTFAADVAARHVELHDKALVTAYLDSATWFTHTHPYRPCHACGEHTQGSQPLADLCCGLCEIPDLYLTGQVTWVGSSSLEVTLELTRPHTHITHGQTKPHQQMKHTKAQDGQSERSGVREEGDSTDDMTLVARARFIMAARDKSLTKAAKAPPLLTHTDMERTLYEEGAARQKTRHGGRKQEDAQPLPHTLSSDLAHLLAQCHTHQTQHTHHASQHTGQPTDAHIHTAAGLLSQHSTALLHRQHTDSEHVHHETAASGQSHSGDESGSHISESGASHSLTTPKSVRSTVMTQNFVTQFQERNTTGTVFGGQLLLYGHSMAELVAHTHVGHTCEPIAMRDVPFMALVPIGCLMHVTGKVVAVKGDLLTVLVRASKADIAHHRDDITHPHTGHTRSEPAVQTQGSNSSKNSTGVNNKTGHSSAGNAGASSGALHGHALTPTHVYWCVLRALPGVYVCAVVPETLHEVRDWVHAMIMMARYSTQE